LNQRAWPWFRAVSVAVSVKIRGKARDTNLTLHRTDADFFEVSRARNGGVDADGSYGFATDLAETATETARSDSV